MTPEQRELLDKAHSSIAAARLLLDNGFPSYCASRTYFAMFYAVEALLEGAGLSFSKHSAVIAAFGRHFALAGKVPVEFHRYLLEAQELRHDADYGQPDAVTAQDAQEQLERAKQFLVLAERLISP